LAAVRDPASCRHPPRLCVASSGDRRAGLGFPSADAFWRTSWAIRTRGRRSSIRPLAGPSRACEKRRQLGSNTPNRGGDLGDEDGNSGIAEENAQAPLAQLDRATASGAVGQRFESSVDRAARPKLGAWASATNPLWIERLGPSWGLGPRRRILERAAPALCRHHLAEGLIHCLGAPEVRPQVSIDANQISARSATVGGERGRWGRVVGNEREG
jgi:hypothetical protein